MSAQSRRQTSRPPGFPVICTDLGRVKVSWLCCTERGVDALLPLQWTEREGVGGNGGQIPSTVLLMKARPVCQT